MLNLSRTHIGDRVILHHIAKLPNLEALYVDKTNVRIPIFRLSVLVY